MDTNTILIIAASVVGGVSAIITICKLFGISVLEVIGAILEGIVDCFGD